MPRSRAGGKTVRRSAAVALALALAVVVVLGLAFGRGRIAPTEGELGRGRAAYERGDWASAASSARLRLKVAPNDEDALRLLARSSVRLGRDAPALAVYARENPDSLFAEDLYLKGLALGRAGKDREAMAAWQDALRIDPDHAETLAGLAQLYPRQHRLDTAAQVAEHLATRPGWECRGGLMLGVLRAEMDDPAGAAAALQRALAFDPKATGAPAPPTQYRKLLARSLLQTGKAAEAVKELESLPEHRSDPEAAWLLSRAWLRQGAIDQATHALDQAGSYRGEHPLEPEPGPFVGEARCASCHAAIHRKSLGTRHTSSYHRGATLEKLPLPPGPLADPGDPRVTHSIERVADRIQVTTRAGSSIYRAVVEMAFGTLGRYLTMVARDDAGDYRALRLSYHHSADGTGWDLTSGDVARPDRPEGYFGKPVDLREGTVRCVVCHTTHVRSGRDRVGPESADRGIGCERCHGPGGNHLAAVAAGFKDPAIVNPELARNEAGMKLCAPCHSLNEEKFEETTPREDPAWVRSPGQTLAWSRCFERSSGTLTCLTCHDAHSDAETSAGWYEAKCLECHGTRENRPARPGASLLAPPCPVNARGACLPCHMPRVRNELLHSSLTDHYIRVHRKGPTAAR